MGGAHRWMLIGIAGAFLPGCTGHRLGVDDRPERRCATVFRIDNRGPEAVDVFLRRGAVVRLGTVPAGRSAHLTNASAPSPGGGVHLIARPVSGGRPVTTDELRLGVGDDVRWTIMEPLEHSSIWAGFEHARGARGPGRCAAPAGAARP